MYIIQFNSTTTVCTEFCSCTCCNCMFVHVVTVCFNCIIMILNVPMGLGSDNGNFHEENNYRRSFSYLYRFTYDFYIFDVRMSVWLFELGEDFVISMAAQNISFFP